MTPVPIDPFSLSDQEWTRLDPAYLRLKRLITIIVWPTAFLIGAAAVVIMTQLWWLGGVIIVLGLLWTLWCWLRQARVFANWGYAERETELYIRRGLWRRKMTVIPYSRMQVVDMEAGPIEHRLGLAKITFVTASIESDGAIPGLNATVAAALRDRLSERGQHQQAGL